MNDRDISMFSFASRATCRKTRPTAESSVVEVILRCRCYLSVTRSGPVTDSGRNSPRRGRGRRVLYLRHVAQLAKENIEMSRSFMFGSSLWLLGSLLASFSIGACGGTRLRHDLRYRLPQGPAGRISEHTVSTLSRQEWQGCRADDLPPKPERGRQLGDDYAFLLDTTTSTIATIQRAMNGSTPVPGEYLYVQGMLFVFPKTQAVTFWMRGVVGPLDIVWLTRDARIAHILHQARPCANLPCRQYRFPAQYVLELQGGQAKAHGLRPGQVDPALTIRA